MPEPSEGLFRTKPKSEDIENANLNPVYGKCFCGREATGLYKIGLENMPRCEDHRK